MKTNRRNFLKSLGGLALFTIVPRPVLGKGFMAPSDQLTKGIIGVGGMGRGHVNYGGTRLVAICDVDRNHLEAGKNLVKESIATYHDFRELIHDPKRVHRVGVQASRSIVRSWEDVVGEVLERYNNLIARKKLIFIPQNPK